MRFVRKCEFARIEGVSKARVSQWLKAGIISEESNGTVDRIEAGRRLDAYRNRPRERKVFQDLDLEEIDIGAAVDSFSKRQTSRPRGKSDSFSAPKVSGRGGGSSAGEIGLK